VVTLGFAGRGQNGRFTIDVPYFTITHRDSTNERDSYQQCLERTGSFINSLKSGNLLLQMKTIIKRRLDDHILVVI
jgi:hypothetical protein